LTTFTPPSPCNAMQTCCALVPSFYFSFLLVPAMASPSHYLINVSSAILHWGEDPQAVST
jgi:hypothetical protein